MVPEKFSKGQFAGGMVGGIGIGVALVGLVFALTQNNKLVERMITTAKGIWYQRKGRTELHD